MAIDNAKQRSETMRPTFIIRLIRRLWRLLVDRSYRNVIWLNLVKPRGAFQPFSDTRADRYPRIFDFVRAQLGADSNVCILSYGCSTGEEAFSLRNYFPKAAIKGIDINPGNIAICRRRLRDACDGGIFFSVGSSTRAEPSATYDAIFAMAVLRHGGLGAPGLTRCDHLIQFEDFAEAVADFARCLKPSGQLIIRHSNFRLADTPTAPMFETVLRVGFPKNSQQTPLFGPDNRLLAGIEYPDTVFRKKSKNV
ncbi:MAG TPA: class I SAM-dependent methyltransferase [Xanthobacteraceae bacterium]|jgi:SAM-dependent methyltransferase|nr:class I SAM-dependent methyltransferase [Xanthobacteraceae bacterium]